MPRKDPPPNATEFRRRAEDRLLHTVTPTPHGDVDPRRLVHELQVHQIELEMQNQQLRQMQAELEQSLDRYTDLFDFAPVGYVTLTAAGLIKEANLAAATLIGVERATLCQSYFSAMVSREDGDRWHRFFISVLEDMGGTLQTTEIKLRRHDGHALHAQLDGMHIIADDPDPRILVALTDITPRKLAEDALREKADLLVQSNTDLEQFAFVASHDLQTPLRNIIHFSQLLERRYKGQLDANADEFIGLVVGSATQMTQLIADLLEYSHLAGQSMPLRPIPAGEAVAQAVNALRLDLDKIGADIIVGDLPRVMAESSRLISLFQNLLGNAIKYRAPDRKPLVSVKAEWTNPDRWCFAVADNGIGIEQQYFDKIFEIFQRLNPNSRVEGTGIGLTLCRRIVHHFGGTIWVDSVPGAGTTFFFTLMGENDHDDQG